ncbi:MmcQ/YjbR family DNA-binding protein [Pseudonocardia xinjiangensis]|uniref:MmcQ/YjbR family DNA-binding protein n=1 Tax=Pseudonocardia xinjiangensis TaxID=75289 RepID=A0ABX1REM7_9PSEU|nr:MmcQ/YjbR family DNA-binding protein [Pseudonocardia xinjiangensis]NMH77854.1 MmcQ/YjbR family DNA-binding protein [Pseudonocardia xinjiangensis]
MDVPAGVLGRLRGICLGLPEAYEEVAWVGVRWRVRTRTFAHVLTVEGGRPAAFARAAGTEGPCTILTFRSEGPELDVLRRSGPPFFGPPWGPEVVGMVLGPNIDWNEVAELITESFCARAPMTLTRQVERPPG